MRDTDIRQRHPDKVDTEEGNSSSSSYSRPTSSPYCFQTSTILTIVTSVLATLLIIGVLYISPCQQADTNVQYIQSKYDTLLMKYIQLQEQITKAQSGGAQALSSSSSSSADCPVCPVCSDVGANAGASAIDTAAAAAAVKAAMGKGGGVSFNSLGENVLELSSHINVADHEKEWLYCDKDSPDHKRLLRFCPASPKSEQMYQLSFYDRMDRRTGDFLPFRRPQYTDCVQLPPPGYKFPPKTLSLPSTVAGVHWPNLRVSKLNDLGVFNAAVSLKNLYHFDAPRYDLEFQSHLEFGARFIPLGSKIRLALDCGSGGGSFGLWLRYKYNIQSLSIAFPDWPYCEYISERGNLCLYLDGYHAFPFAKFTFDLVHVSWIYHSVDPAQLETVFLELIRITRPGGYLWMSDGWSRDQVAVLDRVIDAFGLHIVYDHRDYHPGETSFGKNKYQVQLWQILVKPISAREAPDCGSSTRVFKPQPRPLQTIFPPEDKGIYHTTTDTPATTR